jgi:GNAT superfamily N-acetyltransferase
VYEVFPENAKHEQMNETGTPSPIRTPHLRIRQAGPEDAAALFELVRGLADYEHLPRPDASAQQRLFRDLFSDHPKIFALLAEYDGAPIGYAIYLETYSSFLALPTLYLEDIFVLPQHRKRNVGIALFAALVREAIARDCGRMEWVVLDWNESAIGFYKRLGARRMKEWQTFRLTRDELLSLAGRLTPP